MCLEGNTAIKSEAAFSGVLHFIPIVFILSLYVNMFTARESHFKHVIITFSRGSLSRFHVIYS